MAATEPVTDSAENTPLLPTPASEDPGHSELHTLQDLKAFLRTFLVFVPSLLRSGVRNVTPEFLKDFGRRLLRLAAALLHARGLLASNFIYDLALLFWRTVINIFFREIRSRGSYKVPRQGDGPLLIVVAPHHNQFLDPLLLMSEVRRHSGRRISFLAAEASMKRKYVGPLIQMMQSIPVARAQDLATAGEGTISLTLSDPTLVIGTGTAFTTQFTEPRMKIALPASLGSAALDIETVVDDTHIRLRKPYKADIDASRYKVLPHVDQSHMYGAVYAKLSEGGCIGIFPEGGSHDRTDLLPLKAGVSIMALGALSENPALNLRILPVGLAYFHPHKFRSRAVIEFGSPLHIAPALVADFARGGDAKKDAVASLMSLIVDGLKSVTVRAPDYETLMLVQATRRLYRPPGMHLSLPQVVDLNKRFIVGYEAYKDEPRIRALAAGVRDYNRLLRYLGLRDHQVERERAWPKAAALLAYRLMLLSVWAVLALPGVVLNAPIFVAAAVVSRRKARAALAASSVKVKAHDVLGTWKVLVALAGAPALYSVYAISAFVLATRLGLPTRYRAAAPLATYAGLPLIGLAALRFGEVGMDVYKSLRPLVLSLVPWASGDLAQVRTMRARLQSDIIAAVNEFGPQLFDDFDVHRIVAAPSGAGGESEPFLTHPMAWLDDYLFGWSAVSSANAPERGNTTDDIPDYEEVVHMLSGFQGSDSGAADASRRSSRRASLARRAPSRPGTGTDTPLKQASAVEALQSSPTPEAAAVESGTGESSALQANVSTATKRP